MSKTFTVPALAAAVAAGGALAASPALATPTAPASSPHPQARPAVSSVQTSTLRLEAVGDSITYGYQSSTGNGYRGPLWNELAGEGHQVDFVGSAQGGTMADPDNEGHSGWRIDQIACIVDTSLATYQPNITTLMIGTNDLGQDYQVSSAPARLSSLITQIENDDPSATLLVANLIVSTNTVVAQYEPAYNAAIPGIVQAQQAAGHHTALVDMSAVTTAELADALHPNDTGYQMMADAWNTGVQTAAANGWITAPTSLGAPTARAAAEVASGIAGKCLDLDGGNSADGTPVQLWTCDQTGAQSWTPYTDGTLRTQGECLDATGDGTADGTKTELYDCDGTGGQVWQPYDGGYLNLASGKCLDDPGASATDGTQLELWDCNGGGNQLWAPPTPGPVTSPIAGACVDHAGGSTNDGTVVDLWDCDGGANQQWTAVNNTLVNPASGKCLDDPASSADNGTQLDIWDCDGGANQQWTLHSWA